MSAADEALVEELHGLLFDFDTKDGEAAARAVLAHLGMVGEAEERVEWGVLIDEPSRDPYWLRCRDETDAERMVGERWPPRWRVVKGCRAVRTWRAADGTVTTQVGPWVEVQ